MFDIVFIVAWFEERLEFFEAEELLTLKSLIDDELRARGLLDE